MLITCITTRTPDTNFTKSIHSLHCCEDHRALWYMPAKVLAASPIVSDLSTPHTASCHSPAGTLHARAITEPTVSLRPDHRLG